MPNGETSKETARDSVEDGLHSFADSFAKACLKAGEAMRDITDSIIAAFSVGKAPDLADFAGLPFVPLGDRHWMENGVLFERDPDDVKLIDVQVIERG